MLINNTNIVVINNTRLLMRETELSVVVSRWRNSLSKQEAKGTNTEDDMQNHRLLIKTYNAFFKPRTPLDFFM